MAQKLKRIRGSDNIFAGSRLPARRGRKSQVALGSHDRDRRLLSTRPVTQAEAAKRLGITQPRLNALLKSRIDQFSLDALVSIAGRAGLDVRLVIRKAA